MCLYYTVLVLVIYNENKCACYFLVRTFQALGWLGSEIMMALS